MTDKDLWQYLRGGAQVIPLTNESSFPFIKPDSFSLVIPNEVWREMDARFGFDSESKRQEAMRLAQIPMRQP